MFARKVCLLAAACGVLTIEALAQAPPDIDTLLERVGERVAQFYKRAHNIVWIEKSTAQPIDYRFSPQGFARQVESELRIEADDAQDGDDAATPNVIRELLKVNGRPPREKDKKNREGCTDPNPISPEPLAFLLPGHRSDFKFTAGGRGRGKDQRSLIIEFSALKPEGKGELTEDARGHEDCYNVDLPVRLKGRVWVDATSYDVVRIEQRIAGPGDLHVSPALQRKRNLPGWMVVERHDTTIKYKMVTFADPEEALLLPESIETLTMFRGGLESNRHRQEFSNYRRFVTGGRLVK